MSSQQAAGGSDTGAAFLGLIGGTILIGAILFAVVVLTNRHYESEKAEGGAKGAVKTSMTVQTSSVAIV